jgi:hypothetical protein
VVGLASSVVLRDEPSKVKELYERKKSDVEPHLCMLRIPFIDFPKKEDNGLFRTHS